MESYKDKIYNFLVRKNMYVQYEYERYVIEHIDEHKKNHLKHLFILFKLNWHYRIRKDRKRMIYTEDKIKGKIINIHDFDVASNQNEIHYYMPDYKRVSPAKFAASLVDYDIISFDIFDTLIYRKVEKPNDVFNIMSAEMGLNDFIDIRKKAENFAREIKEKTSGTREIVLEDIYNILEERFNISKKWMSREIELEIEISIPNEYMLSVYNSLLKFNKKIIYITDMYLPLNVIKQILYKNGYTKCEEIFLSNEYELRKGDGTLQEAVFEKYSNKRIVHIGDNYEGDVEKTVQAGIDAVYNPNSMFKYREPELENIAASFYRSIIQTEMNNGLWNQNIYFSHGFRIGGILTAGFCQYINSKAKELQVDKILFCARDCDIIYKAYKQYCNNIDSAYLNISRFSIFNITSEHYLYDLANRYIMRYMKMYRNDKTIADILDETGYGYLIDELDKYNINKFQFPRAVEEKRIMEFIYKCSKIIYEKNTESREAAKKYYSDIIGNAKKILLVDIGWSGTCITAFKYFISENLPDLGCEIFGALMFTNRNDLIKNSVQFKEIYAYINTPFTNMDITRHIFPGPPKSRDTVAMDKLHMPVEYLFTSTCRSLLSYRLSSDGNVDFVYSENDVSNTNQIVDMQNGILRFVDLYKNYTSVTNVRFDIQPYSAFLPLRESISHERYAYEVYKDFVYDAFTPVHGIERAGKYSKLFGNKFENNIVSSEEENKKKILFISPEMIYTGAPRSLLRMCKVARNLGYSVTVWSGKDGPFTAEYAKENFKVDIVPEDAISKKISQIEQFDMAVCNTVVTSKYAEICSQLIPTIWYIREATNMPDFIRNNPEREYIVRNSKNIYVVSEYAAKALEPYCDYPIHVANNCVEDEVDFATNYISGTGEKIKFVQFGTMEYRKGYDVLLAAYKAMPEEYRNISELYFAGGFINSGTPYCTYLFDQMKNMENVHYLGVVRGEENKIKTLSEMDVVVVASRDESCSLVALEGAMLSKPLIVTENVGAKYMVSNDNGYIVDTGDVETLKIAMMDAIDNREKLSIMGEVSREKYEQFASMKAYTKSMKELYSLCDTKGTKEFENLKKSNKDIFSDKSKSAAQKNVKKYDANLFNDKAIISLTSHPGRIKDVEKCIKTLIEQTVRPKKILLYLSQEQFPNKTYDLPRTLATYADTCEFFDIKWVKEDLKPHKKYFYAMQSFPDDPIIIVDDDVYYDKHLVEYLMLSYNKFPDCISANRANLMNFHRDGSIMGYESWIMAYRLLLDIPSTQLVPTGVGGVLYPPHILPEETFNMDIIKDTCLFCDDLWLKIMASYAGVKTVVPTQYCEDVLIDGTQDVALWRMNVRYGNNNDLTLEKILEYVDSSLMNKNDLLMWLRKDRFC